MKTAAITLYCITAFIGGLIIVMRVINMPANSIEVLVSIVGFIFFGTLTVVCSVYEQYYN